LDFCNRMQEWFAPMNLTAAQVQIASLIDARVRELVEAGNDDITLFAEMTDYSRSLNG